MSNELKLPKLDPGTRPDRKHLYDEVNLSFISSEEDQSIGTAMLLKPDVRSNWELHLTASELDAFKGLEVVVQLQINLAVDPFEALWKIIGG